MALQRNPVKQDEDSLKAKPTAGLIQKRWDDGSDDLREHRRNWWVNASYLDGQQWIKWDRFQGTIVQIERDVARTRLTVNRIAKAMASLTGRLTGKPLRFEVKPSAADDATVSGAKLAENVLETAHDVQAWEEIRATEILDAYLGGAAWVYFDWNGSAGEMLNFDESMDRVVGTGEIELCALPITDFCLQPGVRDPYKSAWWVSNVALPVDEAQRRYKLAKRPSPDAMAGKSALMNRLLSDAGKPNLVNCCQVLTCWQPPRDGVPGWVATSIGEELVDGPYDWPFPFNDLNGACFIQRKKSGVWAGSTVLNDCIDIQTAFNCIMSANVEAAKLAGNARLFVDDLSYDLMTTLSDMPGEIARYSSASAGPPVWSNAPGPTRGLVSLAEILDHQLNDALSVYDIGQLNVNRTPAGTIAQLTEAVDTPLGQFAHNQAAGWTRLGRMILQTYADKVVESRQVTVSRAGREAALTQKWNGARLRGQTDVSVPLEATKPFSRAYARQSAIELAGLLPPGTLPPVKLVELWGIDPEDELEILDSDVAKAKRENVKMMAGEEMIPAAFDDHAKHIAEHNDFRKSAAYEEAPPHIKWWIDTHMQAHETMHAEQLGQQAMQQAATPGSAMRPQADAPPGSVIPMPFNQQQALTQRGMPPQLPPGR